MAPLLLAALGLAGCGGGDPESARTPQAVERDLTTAMTDTVCDHGSYATRRFVERSSYGVAEYAELLEELCHDAPGEFAARSVRVSGVRVSGDRATATAVATGGAYAFGRVTFALVRDGVWRIDRVTALDIDRAKFDAVQRRLAKVGDEPPTPAQVDCTVRRLSRLDDHELERAIIASDPTLVTDPTLVCVLRPELRRQGLSVSRTSCIVRQLRSNRGLIGILLREDEEETEDLFIEAAVACAQSSV